MDLFHLSKELYVEFKSIHNKFLCDMISKTSVENSFPKIAPSSGYIRRMTYQVALRVAFKTKKELLPTGPFHGEHSVCTFRGYTPTPNSLK